MILDKKTYDRAHHVYYYMVGDARHLFEKDKMTSWVNDYKDWGPYLFRDTSYLVMSNCRIETPLGGLPELFSIMYSALKPFKLRNKCGNLQCCNPTHWVAITKVAVANNEKP